jgi:hypothetical protein
MGKRDGEELVNYFIAVAMTTAERIRGVEWIRWPELIRGAAEVGVMEQCLHDLRFAIDQPDAPRTIGPTVEQGDAAWSIELDAQLEVALGEPTAPDGSAGSSKVLPTQRPKRLHGQAHQINATIPAIVERLELSMDEMSDGASCPAAGHTTTSPPPPNLICNTDETCAPKKAPLRKPMTQNQSNIRLTLPHRADVKPTNVIGGSQWCSGRQRV